MHRYHALSCVTLIAAALSGAAAAQQPGIFGVYNPITGQFQPATVQTVGPAKPGGVTPATSVARTGTFHVNVAITVKNGTPSTTMPSCYLTVYHSPSGHSYSQTSSMTGTRTADTAHCNFAIFYRWPEADTLEPVTFYLSVGVGSWSANVPLDPIALPANGATTIVTANTIL